jgi:uncharacterized protein (TIGR02001 family)
MKKSLIALALVGAFASPAFAQTAPAAEAAVSPHTVTGNVGLFSSYRFRGIDQTFGKPALQGGIDYSHESGIYVGNWNSNVSEYAGFPDGNLEMDLYGGFKKSFGDFGIDVGGIYYYYPGSDNGKGNAVDNGEVYVGASWKFISFKYSHALTNYFDVANTKNTKYYDLAANYDLGAGWGVNGHVGYTDVSNTSAADYTDWKLGVTKDIGGYVFGLSYIDTDASKDVYTWSKATSGKQIYAGKAVGVLSVSKSF